MIQRLGLFFVGGIPIPVLEDEDLDVASMAQYQADLRVIQVQPGFDRHTLVSCLVHELWHVAEHIILAGCPQPKSETIAQTMGATIASNWDELTRIAFTVKVRT